jgi:hypothetical protein
MQPRAHPRALGQKIVALVVALLLAGAAGYAQYRRGPQLRLATAESFDGAFNFCRIAYRGASNGDGGGWGVDYPRADQNLSVRLSELTKTSISLDKRTGEPNHVLLQLTDPLLFHCPFIMMTEVGSMFLDENEAARLREYLLKGGFLWADDFWGTWAWEVWESQIRKALPSGAFRTIDLSMDHPIFHSLFTVRRVPQIPSINFWRGSGGGTSERGSDSAVARARAIVDERDRMLVFITHNTDIGDSFEHEGTDREYFVTFSVDGYALGIDVLLYSMTH